MVFPTATKESIVMCTNLSKLKSSVSSSLAVLKIILLIDKKPWNFTMTLVSE